MKKIKSFIFSESKLAKAIFGFLVVSVFALVFGPNLYAQFTRQTGSEGWGYGYGYGYGYGFGFDYGTIAGYRITGAAANQYQYNYGYGYRASATSTTVGLITYQDVPVANMAAAVPTLFTIAGTQTAATSLIAADNINFTTTNVNGNIQVLVPSGVAITKSDGTAFDATALTSSDKASSITATTIASDASVKGAIEFGVSGITLRFSAPVTVKIPVDSALNNSALYIKKSVSGSSWTATGLTTASSDTCTGGVGSSPATAVVVSGGYATIYTCQASYFATYTSTTSGGTTSTGSSSGVSNAPSCTSVTYGASYATACFAGYQYRDIATRTPSDCTLTVAQQAAAKRACTIEVTPTGEIVITPSTTPTSDFIIKEKALVVKINKALAKRLAGRILLQIEGKGEAWYVNPVNQTKYFLGRPADAFAIMRKLGLGINNKNFDSYKGKAPARLAGRILLKVEDKGKAYYVNPVDLKMYYLGRPADAFSVMRTLGLGITNANLRQISVGEVK